MEEVEGLEVEGKEEEEEHVEEQGLSQSHLSWVCLQIRKKVLEEGRRQIEMEGQREEKQQEQEGWKLRRNGCHHRPAGSASERDRITEEPKSDTQSE